MIGYIVDLKYVVEMEISFQFVIAIFFERNKFKGIIKFFLRVGCRDYYGIMLYIVSDVQIQKNRLKDVISIL